ncbi:MAG: hypothetical protein BWY55_00832 [archaeon ADurb.Bin336]|nr:MAG: hypothetical protein BWY55_00832 [archaeon ADurb.Bin336]
MSNPSSKFPVGINQTIAIRTLVAIKVISVKINALGKSLIVLKKFKCNPPSKIMIIKVKLAKNGRNPSKIDNSNSPTNPNKGPIINPIDIRTSVSGIFVFLKKSIPKYPMNIIRDIAIKALSTSTISIKLVLS